MHYFHPPAIAARTGGRPKSCCALALAAALLATAPALAQLRPVVINEATVLTGDGRTVENGGVAFRAGQITEVGPGVEASFLAQKIPGRGKYVTPGLVDVYNTLASRLRVGGAPAAAKAADGFDRYAIDEFRAAWRCGITTLYLPARTSDGIGALAAAVRPLPPGSSEDVVLSDEAALTAAIDARGRQGPLARVQTVDGLRGLLRSAREYRESCEDYEDDLKEYEKKLAERAAKQADETKKNKPGEGAAQEAADEKEKDKKKDDKEDELNKPTKPGRNPSAEVLLRVLDGELRLRVEAHHPADILNLLDLADEYQLPLVLEGASGAHLVAERLAELDIPVVLFAQPAALAYDPGAGRYARADAAARLARAGVKVYLGTGTLPGQTAEPQLALAAALAVGHGWNAEAALEAMTSGAARLLGVEDRAGLLAPGRAADIVVWSDHPLAPGAHVERVFLDGQEVYNAERDEEGRRP